MVDLFFQFRLGTGHFLLHLLHPLHHLVHITGATGALGDSCFHIGSPFWLLFSGNRDAHSLCLLDEILQRRTLQGGCLGRSGVRPHTVFYTGHFGDSSL